MRRIAILIAAAALAVAQPARRPGARPGVSTPGVKREMSAMQPQAVFPVEGTPDWQVITDDAVWVTNGPKHIHRLDPRTDQVVAAVEVGRKPCSGLAAGFGSIWVPVCGDQTIARVDTKTNQVTARVPVGPADDEGGIAVGAGSVWIVSDRKGVYSRIDPATNKVAATIAVPAGSASCLFAEGAIWVTTPESSVLTRVDPASNRVVATIPVRAAAPFPHRGRRLPLDPEPG